MYRFDIEKWSQLRFAHYKFNVDKARMREVILEGGESRILSAVYTDFIREASQRLRLRPARK